MGNIQPDTNGLDFSLLSPEEWSVVLLSLVREDIEHHCIYYKKKISPAVEKLPKEHIAIRLRLDTREMGEAVMASLVLESLKTDIREKMRIGFTIAIKGAADSKEHGWKDVLKRILNFASIVGGCSRPVLEELLQRKNFPKDLKQQVLGYLKAGGPTIKKCPICEESHSKDDMYCGKTGAHIGRFLENKQRVEQEKLQKRNALLHESYAGVVEASGLISSISLRIKSAEDMLFQEKIISPEIQKIAQGLVEDLRRLMTLSEKSFFLDLLPWDYIEAVLEAAKALGSQNVYGAVSFISSHCCTREQEELWGRYVRFDER